MWDWVKGGRYEREREMTVMVSSLHQSHDTNQNRELYLVSGEQEHRHKRSSPLKALNINSFVFVASRSTHVFLLPFNQIPWLSPQSSADKNSEEMRRNDLSSCPPSPSSTAQVLRKQNGNQSSCFCFD